MSGEAETPRSGFQIPEKTAVVTGILAYPRWTPSLNPRLYVQLPVVGINPWLVGWLVNWLDG